MPEILSPLAIAFCIGAAAPIQKAIANGDKISGISFMKIVNELDAGPIYDSYHKLVLHLVHLLFS